MNKLITFCVCIAPLVLSCQRQQETTLPTPLENTVAESTIISAPTTPEQTAVSAETTSSSATTNNDFSPPQEEIDGFKAIGYNGQASLFDLRGYKNQQGEYELSPTEENVVGQWIRIRGNPDSGYYPEYALLPNKMFTGKMYNPRTSDAKGIVGRGKWTIENNQIVLYFYNYNIYDLNKDIDHYVLQNSPYRFELIQLEHINKEYYSEQAFAILTYPEDVLALIPEDWELPEVTDCYIKMLTTIGDRTVAIEVADYAFLFELPDEIKKTGVSLDELFSGTAIELSNFDYWKSRWQ